MGVMTAGITAVITPGLSILSGALKLIRVAFRCGRVWLGIEECRLVELRRRLRRRFVDVRKQHRLDVAR